ncbi:MAG TPA: hypothetical protein VF824_09730 [Thermoanaerobaculia bacterium]
MMEQRAVGAVLPRRAWWNEGWSGAVLRETAHEAWIDRFIDDALRALSR